MITSEIKKKAEEQIKNLRKEIDYTTRDYSIDFLVQKFREDEFYIPDEYQRQFIWDDDKKSLFIESVLLGLPIPLMFFSDTEDGRCEIIDGAQRTQSLEAFMSNDLELTNLKKLDSLLGFKYDDIPEYFKKKFDKTNIRVVVLSDETTLDIRQEIFTRINTSGVKANPIEVRRGQFMQTDFMRFIKECSEDDVFLKLCPLSETLKKRYEGQELVLRFFAYLNNYKNFDHRVDQFIDDYVDSNKDTFNRGEFLKEFRGMLDFVNKNFPYGFAKTKNAKATPRVRFEAIAVGVALALRENERLIVNNVDWIETDEFRVHTTSHASNSPSRVTGRIEYVRDMLLEK
ncbi:MAG: DUF262 domain-containing protein [Granulicatella sp.]|nr:DUF262 domain-containing protein [Granulicatella sp.]